MILDGHIHIELGDPGPDDLVARMAASGVDGGLLISPAPASFHGVLRAASPAERLDSVFAWASGGDLLYPVYWVDPTESDALEQVDLALSRGVIGFKVICDHFLPGMSAH